MTIEELKSELEGRGFGVRTWKENGFDATKTVCGVLVCSGRMDDEEGYSVSLIRSRHNESSEILSLKAGVTAEDAISALDKTIAYLEGL